MVTRSTAVDGFQLAYDYRDGAGGAVVLLHGWPGDRSDWRQVTPLLPDDATFVAPDLRGFGESDKHHRDPDGHYDADAQARSVAGLIEQLDLDRPVVAGYDIGSRIAQTLARQRPDLVGSLVLSPPLPGAGDRLLGPDVTPEFWYYGFHRSGLAELFLDGHRDLVRAYLRDRWERWSGPHFHLPAVELEHLVDVYGGPGDFAASIAWYRAGAGLVANSVAEQPPAEADRLTIPVRVLWQEFDPTFPRTFADRLDAFFADVHVTWADGIGHFTPVEAPELVADLIRQALTQ